MFLVICVIRDYGVYFIEEKFFFLQWNLYSLYYNPTIKKIYFFFFWLYTEPK